MKQWEKNVKDTKALKAYIQSKGVIEQLTGKKNIGITKLKALKVSDGGTNCHAHLLVLKDGSEWFIKQCPNSEVKSHLEADESINRALGSYAKDSGFVQTQYSDTFNTTGILVFPKAEGLTALKALKQISPHMARNPWAPKPHNYSPEQQSGFVQKIGQMLSSMQINCLKQAGQEDAFYSNNGNFNGLSIMVHPDFQASNIMIGGENGNVYFLDAGGIGKGDNYKNINELLTEIAPNFKKDVLIGYLSSFPAEKQEQVLTTLKEQLQVQHKFSIEQKDLPKLPVKSTAPVQQAANTNQDDSISQNIGGTKPGVDSAEQERKRRAEQQAQEDARKRQQLELERERQRAQEAKAQRIAAEKEAEEEARRLAELKEQAKQPKERRSFRLGKKKSEKMFTGVVDLEKLKVFDSKKSKAHKKYQQRNKIDNAAGKLLYIIQVGDKDLFWKQAKGKDRSNINVADTREVSGSLIANYVTDGLVPIAHLRTVDNKMGIGQEMITFKHFEPNDSRLDKLTPDQVAQIMAHLISDKMCSNYDCHFDQFGVDPQGNIIAVDKGEAFLNFKSGRLGDGNRSDRFDFDVNRFGRDEFNFYKAITDRIKDGRLSVDFDSPIIQNALNKIENLTSDDIKKIYSPYAEMRFKSGRNDRTPQFYEAMQQRAKDVRGEFNKFRLEVSPSAQVENKENIGADIKQQTSPKSTKTDDKSAQSSAEQEKIKAGIQALRKAEEEKARAAEQAKQAEEKARAEAEAQQRAKEEQARKEAQAQQQAKEEQARKEAEAKQQAKEEQARKEAEAQQQAKEEQARKEAEAKQQAKEEQARKEAEAQQQAEEEQARKEAEAQKLAEEEQARKEAEAQKLAEEEQARKEADAQKLAEEEQKQTKPKEDKKPRKPAITPSANDHRDPIPNREPAEKNEALEHYLAQMSNLQQLKSRYSKDRRQTSSVFKRMFARRESDARAAQLEALASTAEQLSQNTEISPGEKISQMMNILIEVNNQIDNEDNVFKSGLQRLVQQDIQKLESMTKSEHKQKRGKN